MSTSLEHAVARVIEHEAHPSGVVPELARCVERAARGTATDEEWMVVDAWGLNGLVETIQENRDLN